MDGITAILAAVAQDSILSKGNSLNPFNFDVSYHLLPEYVRYFGQTINRDKLLEFIILRRNYEYDRHINRKYIILNELMLINKKNLDNKKNINKLYKILDKIDNYVDYSKLEAKNLSFQKSDKDILATFSCWTDFNDYIIMIKSDIAHDYFKLMYLEAFRILENIKLDNKYDKKNERIISLEETKVRLLQEMRKIRTEEYKLLQKNIYEEKDKKNTYIYLDEIYIQEKRRNYLILKNCNKSSYYKDWEELKMIFNL